MQFVILPEEKEYKTFANSIKDLLTELDKNNGDLEKIGLKALITPPDGYALKIIKELEDLKNKRQKKGLTRVQLRKIFQEFKNIYSDYKKNKNKEKCLNEIYKLYFIISYQRNRNLIDPDIQYLFWNLIKVLEKSNLEQFDLVMDFINALVAYIPKES